MQQILSRHEQDGSNSAPDTDVLIFGSHAGERERYTALLKEFMEGIRET
jgi:hypothetical protein